jgi:membrane-bound serine protease (ClpP class)
MHRIVNLLLWALLIILILIVVFNIAAGLSYIAVPEISPESMGFLLIILALVCFILEMVTAGFGLFTAAGIITLTIGSIILFNISPLLIAVIDITAAAAIGLMVNSVRRAQRRGVTTGIEEMPGKTAVVKETLDPEGMVLFEGELWKAVSLEGRIDAGELVNIQAVNGLTLCVIKCNGGN